MSFNCIISDGQVRSLGEKILKGHEISHSEALELAGLEDERSIHALTMIANKVRQINRGDELDVDLCAIISARTGNCELSCAFCSQSAGNTAKIDVSGMKSTGEILQAAQSAEAFGARRFCIVTSGIKITDNDLSIACEAIRAIRKLTDLKCCASMGIISRQQALQLKTAGLERYHNNLESSRTYYSKISTAGLYDEKIRTLRNIKDLGVEICSGGILGMGESPVDRIDLAFELKALDPDSVPVNFFRPFKGSKLSDSDAVSSLEAQKYLSIFRLILPSARIRLGAGRERTFGDDIRPALYAGVNGLLIGDYLTVKGNDVKSDLSLLSSMGLSF